MEVFASTLTFIGSVTPVVFEGITPVVCDSAESLGGRYLAQRRKEKQEGYFVKKT